MLALAVALAGGLLSFVALASFYDTDPVFSKGGRLLALAAGAVLLTIGFIGFF